MSNHFQNPIPQDPIPQDSIDVGSGCSPTGNPFVEVRWQDKGAQLAPEEARFLANNLMLAAAAAEADAMLLRFFRKNKFPEGAWGAMIIHWREFREQAAGEERKS